MCQEPRHTRAAAIGNVGRGVPGLLYSCVMEFNWGGEIYELMLTRRPSGTHLSESSTPGWKSPLARDDDNTLVTHTELSDGAKTALVLLGTGIALGTAAMKAAPHVKNGLVSMKSKLRSRAEDITDVETPVPLTVVAEIEPEQSLSSTASCLTVRPDTDACPDRSVSADTRPSLSLKSRLRSTTRSPSQPQVRCDRREKHEDASVDTSDADAVAALEALEEDCGAHAE